MKEFRVELKECERWGDGRFAGDLPAKQPRLLYPAGCREHLRKAMVQCSGSKTRSIPAQANGRGKNAKETQSLTYPF